MLGRFYKDAHWLDTCARSCWNSQTFMRVVIYVFNNIYLYYMHMNKIILSCCIIYYVEYFNASHIYIYIYIYIYILCIYLHIIYKNIYKNIFVSTEY